MEPDPGVPDSPGAAAGGGGGDRAADDALTNHFAEAAGSPPKWIITAVIGLAVLLSAALGVMIQSVIALHEHDVQIDHRICQAERVDRNVDRQLVTRTGLRIYVPPVSPDICS